MTGLTMAGAFSGVDGFETGFRRAGFDVLWRCEIDRQCNDVIRYHHPDLKTYTDVTELPALIDAGLVATPDVFTFGSPCQDLSMAGKRAGLKGAKSGLFYAGTETVRALRDRGLRYAIWENVPGVLHCNGGEDFRAVLNEFLDLRPADVAWAVLDSRYFGVAQRRRRVFLVADFRGERSGEILALADGLSGNPAPSRETGTRIAPCLTGGPPFSCTGNDRVEAEAMVVDYKVGSTLKGGSGAQGWTADDCAPLVPEVSFSVSTKAHHNETQETFVPEFSACLLGKPRDSMAEDLQTYVTHSLTMRCAEDSVEGLQASESSNLAVKIGMSVRRLTPRECERLQGFSDDWTRHGRREDGAVYEMADGPRYRMLGNAVTVNVAEWIARQVLAQELEAQGQGVLI